MPIPKERETGPEQRDDGWAVSCPSQVGLNPKALAALVPAIARDEHPDFHSLLVARHGKLVFESYFNGYDRDALHDMRSAGKSFTSTLVGIAIDQGAIPTVDALVLSYFARYAPVRNLDDRKAAIRLEDLLTMRSGLDADDDDPASPGQEDTMLRSDDWIRYSLDLPMREAPGRRWVYAGVNTLLLAGVLEAATERPLLEFALDCLFEPLGVRNVIWRSSPQGVVAGQGFLYLCGRDMLKLGQLYLNGGTWLGQRIVAGPWTEAATAFRIELPGQPDAGYGYQWWSISVHLEDKSFRCYFASGNGGNKIYVLPALDLVVAMASSAYGRPYGHTRSHEVLRQVIRAAM